MPVIHDVDHRRTLRNRLASLRPDSERLWGRMSVDQMLWHVNAGLGNALGEVTTELRKIPIPRSLMRMIAFTMPWPKSTPTAPEYLARDRYEFEAERERCHTLIERVAALPLAGTWPVHPAFGQMNGRQWSRLEFLHLNHHFRQFSA